MHKLVYLAVPAGLASAAYLAAYLYVNKYRNIFKDIGVPYIEAKNWAGNWDFLTASENFFVADQELVNKHGGFFGTFEGRQPILLITEPEAIRQVLLKDFDSFTDRRSYGGAVRTRTIHFTLTSLTGVRWKHVRQQITPAFTPNALRRMNPLIWRCVKQLCCNIGKMSDAGEDIDIRMFSGCFTMDVIASVAFGIEGDSLNNPDTAFVKHAQTAFAPKGKSGGMSQVIRTILMFPFIMKILDWMLPKDAKVMEPFRFFENVVKNEINRRRQATDKSKQRPDFLQMIMHLEKDVNDPANKVFIELDELGLPWLKNGLLNVEIVAQAILFFLAGYETTANVLSFALYALATNPKCQQQLFDEIAAASSAANSDEPLPLDVVYDMKYLDMCINETLRLYAPLSRIERQCTKETVIGGVRIPTEMVVSVPVEAIHRDPVLWHQPDKFDPERFSPENAGSIPLTAFMPFGHGNRNCIGMRLALLELKLALIKLIQQFRFEMSPNTVLPFKLVTGQIRRVENPIFLNATRRKSQDFVKNQ